MSARGIDQAIFWGHVDKSEACWNWTGSIAQSRASHAPYGKYSAGKMAHRVAYELLAGPIPKGLELDHLCRNTLCVNPDHLEPVTRAENMRRRVEALTHCPHGHELTPENCIGDSKWCLTCSRERSLAYYYRVRRARLGVDPGRRDRECRNGHPRTPENTYITPAGHRQCRECKRSREQRAAGRMTLSP